MAQNLQPADQPKSDLHAFARRNRLRVRLDECGEEIILGKRGHIYVEDGKICCMCLSLKKKSSKTLAKLQAEWLWIGTVSDLPTGVRVQDVWAKGIADLPFALRLCGIRVKRTLTAEEIARLDRIGSISRWPAKINPQKL